MKKQVLNQMTFTRVNSDINGNPRHATHFLNLLTDQEKGLGLSLDQEYILAVKRANTIGGRKFHNKQFGGGIVFQSYNIQDTANKIVELLEEV